MRSKLLAAIAAALALGLAAVMFVPAAATPPSGLTATVVALGATARPVSVHSNGIEVESKGATDTYTVHNVFAATQPPSSSGWHSHPGAVFVTVTAGTLTLYRRNCRSRTYTAGQTFVERGRRDVVLARNEGTVQAETITTLMVPHGSRPGSTSRHIAACSDQAAGGHANGRAGIRSAARHPFATWY